MYLCPIETENILKLMKIRTILLAGIMLLATGGFCGCSDDDDDDNEEPVVVVKSGAQMQVMVVFAAGQLGDKGYADRVMDGVNLIDANQTGPDSTKVDLDFISLSNSIFTRRSMEQWLKIPSTVSRARTTSEGSWCLPSHICWTGSMRSRFATATRCWC